jgi:hypothetical protein
MGGVKIIIIYKPACVRLDSPAGPSAGLIYVLSILIVWILKTSPNSFSVAIEKGRKKMGFLKPKQPYFGLKGGWLTFWISVACATDMTL